MNEQCKNCRFWFADGPKFDPYTIHKGEQIWSRQCRRFPEYMSRHPVEWCGEYQSTVSKGTNDERTIPA